VVPGFGLNSEDNPGYWAQVTLYVRDSRPLPDRHRRRDRIKPTAIALGLLLSAIL
jgi:hypothetical protein